MGWWGPKEGQVIWKARVGKESSYNYSHPCCIWCSWVASGIFEAWNLDAWCWQSEISEYAKSMIFSEIFSSKYWDYPLRCLIAESRWFLLFFACPSASIVPQSVQFVVVVVRRTCWWLSISWLLLVAMQNWYLVRDGVRPKAANWLGVSIPPWRV